MTRHWKGIFAADNIMSTEEDIINVLGEETSKNTKKVTEAERYEMEAEIELKDIETVICKLKLNKGPGMTGLTKEFCKNICKDLNIWILQYIHYTEEIGQLYYLQKQGSLTLIPKGQKDKRQLENWRPITLLNPHFTKLSLQTWQPG